MTTAASTPALFADRIQGENIGLPPAEFAEIWRNLDKVVVSKTLRQAKGKRTSIVPEIDLDEMRRLKASAAKDLAVAGPTLETFELTLSRANARSTAPPIAPAAS